MTLPEGNSKNPLNCFVCYLFCKCVAVVQMGASDSDTWPTEENQIERDFSFDPEILNYLCVTHMRKSFTPLPYTGENSCFPQVISLKPVLWIRDILLRIRIRTTDLRIRILFFRQWLTKSQQKISLFSKFFCYYF
jgi:hypothetical protein